MQFFSKLNSYWRLARFDRPIGSYLLLWPTLSALFFAAQGLPPLNLLVIFTLGVFSMRSAGCVINDFADKDYDKFVERTKNRPLARGELSNLEALSFFIILLIISLFLVLATNKLTIYMAFIGLLLAGVYPFLKRLTNLPQFGLGLAFSWGIPMAFTATIGTIPNGAWVLMMANIFWVLAYDTIYALDDLPYDKKIGVKSTAIAFGSKVKFVIFLLDFLAFTSFFIAGILFGRGNIFIFGMFLASIFLVYENIKLRNAKEYLPIFLNNNYFGMTMFLAIVLDYLYS